MYFYWTSAGLWLAWCAYWFVSAQFTTRTKNAESWFGRLTHLAPLGIAFYLIFHDSDHAIIYGTLYRMPWVQVIGVAITAAGLSFAVWARLHLGKYWSGTITVKDEHKLIRTGPYRFVRHPIYTGFITAAIGSAITIGTADAWIGAAIIVPTCLAKIWREEKFLSAEFTEDYPRFRNEVAMLVPFVW